VELTISKRQAKTKADPGALQVAGRWRRGGSSTSEGQRRGQDDHERHPRRPETPAAIQRQIQALTAEALTLTTIKASTTRKPNIAAPRYARILTESPGLCV
jgi:hypothetical protein